jgi:hypothetical protein
MLRVVPQPRPATDALRLRVRGVTMERSAAPRVDPEA